MKRKQFTEEQIIGILKEAEAGGDGAVPQARHVERDLLCVEGQVRRPGGPRRSGCGRWKTRTVGSSGCWRTPCWTMRG
ncbi:hypothetical protein AB5I41_10360 [Sphingomonas sp. MMS24-JH45]